MAWKKANVGMVLPDEIDQAVKTLDKTFTEVKSIFSAMRDVIKNLVQFSNAVTDPATSIFGKILDNTQDFVDSWFNAGLHTIYTDSFESGVKYSSDITQRPNTANITTPLTTPEQRNTYIENLIEKREQQFKLTPVDALGTINNSLMDVNDVNRPILSNTTEVAVLSIIITAPSILDFTEKLEFVSKFFSLQSIDENLKKFSYLSSDNNIVFKSLDVDVMSSSIKLPTEKVKKISVFGEPVTFGLISGLMIYGLRRFLTYFIRPYTDDSVRVYKTLDDARNDKYIKFVSVNNPSEYYAKTYRSDLITEKPDWKSIKMTDISGVMELYRTLNSILEFLRSSSKNVNTSINQLLELIDKKILEFDMFSSELQRVINDIYAMSKMTGVYLSYADSENSSEKGYQFLNKYYSNYDIEGGGNLSTTNQGLTAVISVVAVTGSRYGLANLYRFLGGKI